MNVGHGKTGYGAKLGPALRVVALIVLLASSFYGGSAGAEAPVAGAATGGRAATGDWWAAAQAYIMADQGLGVVDSLGPDPDWTATGQYNWDSFGTSVAGAGDVNGDGYADLIVGAYGYNGGANQGKAYLFYGSASGLSPSAVWTATGESDGQGFGRSVAGAGDVNGDGYADVIVGAYTYPGGGKAYVFHGAASGLATAPAWTATGDQNGDLYGKSVAAAGDVNGDGYADVIVGAEGDSTATGKAYVYHGSAFGLGATAAWTDTGPATSNNFGASVAGAGDVDGDGYGDVIVGSPGYTTDRGMAYVYHGSPSGLSLDSDWRDDGAVADDLFGGSVAAAGDVNGDGYGDVIVGAPGADAGINRGRAYVYHGADAGLSTLDWSASGSSGDDYFGAVVAGVGDVDGDGYADVVIGSPGRPGPDPWGAAYLYTGSDAGLLADYDWMDSGETQISELGASVAAAGDVNGDGYADVVVGAPAYPSGFDKGRAYVYHGSASPPSDTEDWIVTGENDYDYFASVVASAGDVDGDGYADVLVGAPAYVGTANQGKAYLFRGSPDGLSTFPAWTATGQYGGDKFGHAVASAGDMNGDGFSDVIVGAPTYPTGASMGRVYLYYGSASGLPGSHDWIASGQDFSDLFGDAVAGAGDLNGDGYADLVVGAFGESSSQGAVYVYYGSPTGPASTPDWTASGEKSGDWFGDSMAGAGDVDGDGYGDLIVGAPFFDNGGQVEAGKTYLYAGSASGLGASPTWTMTSLSERQRWGRSVAGAGDVNGDGYGDVIVGAPDFGSAPGLAQVFHGGASGLPGTPSWTVGGEDPYGRFGTSVSGAGDVNGDGYADVIVGASSYDDGTNDGAGKAYVYYGSAGGLESDPAWGVTGEAQYDSFGGWVAGAGDVDGDGFSDVLSGAKYHGSDQGAAYAYLGNGGGGRQVLAQQTKAGGGGELVPPWGLSQSASSFVTSMLATHPAGRAAVKLQVDACPPGVPFGDNACTALESADWETLDATPDGALMLETLTGFDPLTLYRWRARLLYAPLFVVRAGITPPPNPAHGPWRRFLGQAFEADIRTSPCSQGVSVTPETQSTGGVAGQTVRFAEQVKNTGDCADTFDVTLTNNVWPTNAPSTVGPLQPGEWTYAEVTVDIPPDASEGNFDLVGVEFASQGDASVSDSCALGTHVVSGWFTYLPLMMRNAP